MLGAPSSIDQNLILTGYIGPNQLAIARRVAERLRMPFVNFEQELEERAEMPPDELRALYGEARLKTVEGELIDQMALYRGVILHVSGQTLMHGDNLARLRTTGPVICLVATLDAVLQRLHLSMGARYHNPRERDLALGTLRREWAVRGHSGVLEFDTSYLTEAATVEGVASLWLQESGIIEWHGA